MDNSPPRTALYIRVSTEEQAVHGLSLEAQQAALTKWATEHQCKIVGVYVDGGKTARKALNHRTELLRLLSDVEADKIDLIIFTKLDRWFRNIKDYYKVQEVLEKHHTDWKTIFENYDTTTANGRLYINIMLSLAQDEADRTSERIKAVFENKIKNGGYITRSVPIGYKVENSKVLVDKDTAEIAVDMFENYRTYNSYYGTRRYLTDKYGRYIDIASIKRALKNRLYIGEYKGIKDFCEPLIEPQVFEEVQKIIETRNIKRPPSDYDYIFTGMIVCGDCGRRLSGTTTKQKRKGGGYYEHHGYRCNSFYSTGNCRMNSSIGEKKIEKYLLENVASELEKYILSVESKQKRRKPKVDKTAIKHKMERLKDLYVNDLIDLDEYKADYAALQEKLAIEEPPPNLQPLKDFLSSDFKENYYKLDNIHRRILWRGIISKLVIGLDKKITIYFTN